jgi:hypothetical protein
MDKPEIKDNERLITLTQGYYAIVDKEDYDELNRHSWYVWKSNRNFYASRTDYSTGKQKTILMHRQIIGLTDRKQEIDHIDHDGLNNKRSNIRVVTHAQNLHNMRPNKNSSSKYKGVCWNKNLCKWQAGIEVSQRKIHLGLFHDEEEAAKAYDKKAVELFGEYSCLNFPSLTLEAV